MNKKVIIGLIIVLILVSAGAGCFSDDPKPPSGPYYNEMDEQLENQNGWIDDDGNQGASATIPLTINASAMITSISIKMRFEDSDSTHSESDEGSDPDEVTIKLSNGVMESEPSSGSTPCNLEVTMAPNSTDEEAESLIGNWEISITGICNGGKPRFILGLLVWIDQGIAYTLDGTYSYLEKK